MEYVEKFVWQGHFWITASLALALVVVISSLADRKRHKRTNIEAVGFVPWTMITILSVLGTVLSAALAIKGF